MYQEIIPLQDSEMTAALFGSFDENIKILQSVFPVAIVHRESEVRIQGEENAVLQAKETLLALLKLLEKGQVLNEQMVRYVLQLVQEGQANTLKSFGNDCVCITAKGKPIKPKTVGQSKYIKAIAQNTVTLGIGPAGTGKTYLAVSMAVSAFRAGDVERIILTRPAVEAGEKLGFLPGDMQNKVDPYLRPLYDALFDMMGNEAFGRCLERGTIEVAPLAFMRGRTLDNSFMILDEAQNTTTEQMKMFLTRLGIGTKAVITGDVTQIDLPDGKRSGLLEASKVLKNVPDIAQVHFMEKDVVRHKIVQDIIRAYDKFHKERGFKNGKS